MRIYWFSETKDFVDTLFLCLKNKTYLPPPSAEPKAPTVTPAPVVIEPQPEEKRNSVSDKESVNKSEAEDKAPPKRRPDDLRNRVGI